MTSAASAAPSAGEGKRRGFADFVGQTLAVAEVEARKLIRDPTELVTRAVQPVLWLLIFGQVFSRSRAIPTGDLTYLEFLAPGILAQGVLFSAIFYGIAVIWERDLGIVHKLLVSPAARASLVLGKAISPPACVACPRQSSSTCSRRCSASACVSPRAPCWAWRGS